ncbi:methyl-accepting chemotaxis protein [Ancylothrix sp. C2]|uniref:methyl-accepting chemotaxis protein n=1 Tax=Ancylothrix sp. D3o TaxID=2953691 RepID=UPI0021BA5880|nr:methyl-accepting chemotaxis protein [Ancylothrix sp. D3o]MCT7951032.1 methyl-accepting chemotaxis protein [Ancylothrix sp. D3o]
MAPTTDYSQEYEKAQAAYTDGNYEEAAVILDRLVQEQPEDYSVRLLRGNIYCYVFNQYEQAREEYEAVLHLTSEPDYTDLANQGLAHTNQFLENSQEVNFDEMAFFEEPNAYNESSEIDNIPALDAFEQNSQTNNTLNTEALDELGDFDLSELEGNSFDLVGSEELESGEYGNPFLNESESEYSTDHNLISDNNSNQDIQDPFALHGNEIADYQESDLFNYQENHFGNQDSNDEDGFLGTDLPDFLSLEEMPSLEEIDSREDFAPPVATSDQKVGYGNTTKPNPEATLNNGNNIFIAPEENDLNGYNQDNYFGNGSFDGGEAFDDLDDAFGELEWPESANNNEALESAWQKATESNTDFSDPFAGEIDSTDSTTASLLQEQASHQEQGKRFPTKNAAFSEDATLLMGAEKLQAAGVDYFAETNSDLHSHNGENGSSNDYRALGATYTPTQKNNGYNGHRQRHEFDAFDSGDYEEDPFSEASLGSEFITTPNNQKGASPDSFEYLDEFEDFDDYGGIIPDFDLSEDSTGATSPSPAGFNFSGKSLPTPRPSKNSGFNSDLTDGSLIRDDEIFSIAGTSEPVPTFAQPDQSIEPTVTHEQGWLAFFENAPLPTKQLWTALTGAAVTMIATAAVSYTSAMIYPIPQLKNAAMSLAAGVASGLTTLGIGQLTSRQIKRSTDDLQSQFEAVSQGNLGARATVLSEDEFGALATKFNSMARIIFTTTSEAQRKAEEQEQAKEDLQRQVIRLLDDVEGAARGDLTVQAEVTADVLGAVADSFNLTIQNLREIVMQVKLAARQVTKGSADSESFARSLASDALRQAEELAATLNSVQVMTDSIQRVADSAREAEEVARLASATAIKGGEAVEQTVAGILEIRENVAETTRKVKRLAESSQEISKIVALISQIASRTNLLALNASIEAARAGEAGRGFAIVADEVRQLADRSAKSLKEIEQIVMQIQSETGQVMTAMEEGTQQVLHGTRLAEQAKRSLDEIIQVAQRIDVLVRSITADTVEQTETSRAVAQVMQAVELTAQETSQEAQRVSGALQNLVGVARDLLTSVERFRVDTTDR